MSEIELKCILGIQILSLSGTTWSYHSGSIDSVSLQKYLLIIASFLTHLLASQCLEIACIMACQVVRSKKLPELKLKNKYKYTLYMLLATSALTMYYSKFLLEEEFLMLWLACALVRYLERKSRTFTITYGEGMACSFTEGFLFHVIPPHGNYHGIVDAIRTAESSRRVWFPLRRLLVVFPRSWYRPRNLDAFNKSDKTLPRLELCQSLPDIHCDVAGVRNRVFRLTVYKIRRRPADPRPVHVVCVTPINSLWMMLQKHALYTPFASADTEEISEAFRATLLMITRNSDELRDKCDLVYYDDTDPNANLATVLLAKIREIEPNYEDLDIDL